MRIIAGQHRGTRLADIGTGDLDAHLRPTTDRVRENLFNVLQGGRFGDPIRNARVLDLFAGTGALGLEALSRGASQVTFVENGKIGQRLIAENIGKIRCETSCQLLRADATALSKAPNAFDLVFLDPPYGKALGQAALASAQKNSWLAPEAIIVWEENAAQIPPAGFSALDQRNYGDTWVTIMKAPR